MYSNCASKEKYRYSNYDAEVDKPVTLMDDDTLEVEYEDPDIISNYEIKQLIANNEKETETDINIPYKKGDIDLISLFLKQANHPILSKEEEQSFFNKYNGINNFLKASNDVLKKISENHCLVQGDLDNLIDEFVGLDDQYLSIVRDRIENFILTENYLLNNDVDYKSLISCLNDFKNAVQELEEKRIELKQYFLSHNIRLIISVAVKYSKNKNMLDMIQNGYLGLDNAFDKFDSTKDYKFSTYAMFWIKQSIQRRFSDDEEVPVWLYDVSQQYKKFIKQYLNQYGIEPTDEEIMKNIMRDKKPITKDHLERIKKYLNGTKVYLSTPCSNGSDETDCELGDFIKSETALDEFENAERQMFIRPIIKYALESDVLTPKQKYVLKARYGLLDGSEKEMENDEFHAKFGLRAGQIYTLDDIGEDLIPRATREWVRQIESRALKKLKNNPKIKKMYYEEETEKPKKLGLNKR